MPFVQSIRILHNYLHYDKVKLPPPTPLLAENFWVDFKFNPATAGFQSALTKVLDLKRSKTLVAKTAPASEDRARLNSLLNKTSSFWLSTPPISYSYILSNAMFSVSVRLRLGLPPTDHLRHCSCGTNLSIHPLHFLTCKALRVYVISRHDLVFQSLASTARLCGFAVHHEPRLSLGKESTRSDGQFFSTVCPPMLTLRCYIRRHQLISN